MKGLAVGWKADEAACLPAGFGLAGLDFESCGLALFVDLLGFPEYGASGIADVIAYWSLW